jgi:hypothetical protein
MMCCLLVALEWEIDIKVDADAASIHRLYSVVVRFQSVLILRSPSSRGSNEDWAGVPKVQTGDRLGAIDFCCLYVCFFAPDDDARAPKRKSKQRHTARVGLSTLGRRAGGSTKSGPGV